jgi:hypothetical protein
MNGFLQRTFFAMMLILMAAGAIVVPAGGAAAQGSATLEVTLRGCNEGVDPRTGNPSTKCTTPLDAPGDAGVHWGGDGQGGMPFADMARHNDGTYEVQIPANTEVSIFSMFPSLRTAYFVPELNLDIWFPGGDGAYLNASPGETIKLHYYYYYYPETSATMTILMRGCPDGFDPDADDFFDDCTTPLDAPDASFIYWGGDGQGGMEITGLDRLNNGAYVYEAGTHTMNVELSGLAPVVRNAYQVFGFDDVTGDAYAFNLADGETREVHVFYYNETGGGSATINVTLRGCPDGVDPSAIANPASTCTTPLDAPDDAAVIWGGDGQGGQEIFYYDRLNDGTYHLDSLPANQTILLTGFAPSVRDSWLFTGDVANTVNADVELWVDAGGTYQVYVYYFNAP